METLIDILATAMLGRGLVRVWDAGADLRFSSADFHLGTARVANDAHAALMAVGEAWGVTLNAHTLERISREALPY